MGSKALEWKINKPELVKDYRKGFEFVSTPPQRGFSIIKACIHAFMIFISRRSNHLFQREKRAVEALSYETKCITCIYFGSNFFKSTSAFTTKAHLKRCALFFAVNFIHICNFSFIRCSEQKEIN